MNQWQTQQISDKKAWESEIAHFPEANFLQSWNWGEFEERLGKTVIRLAVYEGQQVVALAQGVVERAKRGSYLAVAGGPLLEWSNLELLAYMFDQLKQHAKLSHCSFIRFRPQELDTPTTQAAVRTLKAVAAPMHLTADLTLQLDLRQSPDDLLMQMRKNTRGDIRKAERLGIRVETSQDPADIQRFYQVQLELANKHGFVPFSYEFLHEQFKIFAADNQALLIRTLKDNQLLAESYVLFYNHEAVYHYGISTDANRKLPGAYLGQWAAILEAKKRGCQRYNFWGIAPPNKPEHRFAGVTLFKTGFGGEPVAYLPAQDIPLDWSYWFTFLFEELRRKLRRL